jgi:signal transduction histidine kinase
MATGVAHDFNNVLDTIGQAVAVLDMKTDAPAEERRQFFAIIRSAVQQGAGIVSRVRDYVSFRAGHWTGVNIAKLIEECIELTRPLWHPAQVQLVRDCSQVPMVWGNVADLRRVFTNLIINALEAMPKGGRLTITCRRENGNIKVSVSDTGSGIPVEHRANIFRPYFTTKSEGTGIGLSGAQTIVRAHGGDISFHSEVNAGTTFWVLLPIMNSRQ